MNGSNGDTNAAKGGLPAPHGIRSAYDRSLEEIKEGVLRMGGLVEEQIRTAIIATTSVTGGHLGPSLGVVELTIALHRVMDSPTDRLVFDTGHQAYPHKLLTGRYDRFHTLRQLNGIAGYPRRSESPHDPFGTSHGSTSIAAALGYAAARDLKGDKNHVIAIIGDGALNYRGENLFEIYYNLNIWKKVGLSLDYQHVQNPAYNADRGPVNFFAARVHAEF